MKILFALFSYLVGSFPSGFIFFRLSEKSDIRHYGSQSIGATNVLRLKGWVFALPVVSIDVLKGFFPAFLALKFLHDLFIALFCALMAILGHCFPVYIKFKGGKGVATSFGAMAALAFKPTMASLAVFFLIVGMTRYVSLGSLLAFFSLPFFILLFKGKPEILLLSCAIFCIILLKHKSNIRRLWKGEERKLGQKIRMNP